MDDYQEIANITDEPRFGDITILINKNQPNIKAMKKQKFCKNQYEFNQQEKEIEIRKQIQHPNVMSILHYSINKQKQTTSVFYEFPEKQLKIKKIDKGQIINFFSDILQGLIYLNSKKLIHGDLRPKYLFFDAQNSNYKIADRLSSADPPLQTQMKNVYSFKPLYINNLLFDDLINKKKRVKLRPIKNEVFSLGMITLENFLPEIDIQKFYDYDKKSFRKDLFSQQMNRLINEETNQYLRKFLQFLQKDVLILNDSLINKQELLQKIQFQIEEKNQNFLYRECQDIYQKNEGFKYQKEFSISSQYDSKNQSYMSSLDNSQFMRTATFQLSPQKRNTQNKVTIDKLEKNKLLKISIATNELKNPNRKVRKLFQETPQKIEINFSIDQIETPIVKQKIATVKQVLLIEKQFQMLGINLQYTKNLQNSNNSSKQNSDLEQFKELLFTFEKQKNTPKKKRESSKLKDYLKKSPIVSQRQIKKQKYQNLPQKKIVRSFSYIKLQENQNKTTKKKQSRNTSQMLYNCCLQKKENEKKPQLMKQSYLLDNIQHMNLFISKKRKQSLQEDLEIFNQENLKEPETNQVDKCNQDLPYQIILNDINLKIELKEFNLIEIFKKKTLNKRKKSQQIIKLQRQNTEQFEDDIYSSKYQNEYNSINSSTKKRTSSKRQINPERYRFNFEHDQFRPTVQTHENNFNANNMPHSNEIDNDIISLETITFKNLLNSSKKNKKIYSKNNSPLVTQQSNNLMSNSVLPDIPTEFKRNLRNLRKKTKLRDSQLEKLHDDSSCNLNEFKKMGIKMLIEKSKNIN